MSVLFYRMRQQQGCHIPEEIFVVTNMSTSNLTVNILLYLYYPISFIVAGCSVT